MDRIDKQILEIMKGNARISMQELGDAIGMSRVAAKKRVQKLERDGIIRGYNTCIYRDDEITMFITKTMCETPIEVLDMSVRSNNCLRRANIKTVGDIADAIANGVDLANISNCGAKSRREIMERMMLFQYYSLPEKQRGAY